MPSSRRARLRFSSLIVLWIAAAAGADEAPATQSVGGAQPEKPFVIRLLTDGKPVPHAIVCTEHEESADASSQSIVKWVVGHHPHSRPFVSDDSGVATLPFDEVFPFHVDNQQALYALDSATGRVAIAKVRRDATNRELT